MSFFSVGDPWKILSDAANFLRQVKRFPPFTGISSGCSSILFSIIFSITLDVLQRFFQGISCFSPRTANRVFDRIQPIISSEVSVRVWKGYCKIFFGFFSQNTQTILLVVLFLKLQYKQTLQWDWTNTNIRQWTTRNMQWRISCLSNSIPLAGAETKPSLRGTPNMTKRLTSQTACPRSPRGFPSEFPTNSSL